ncbi:uncharacterized protein PG986_006343 [Apiospora aurea]|uniref:Uncharacterized protein n=1 Tax=Apiospora aurea TaxID=335848 RepID=A0ABR1QK54_9PEZI
MGDAIIWRTSRVGMGVPYRLAIVVLRVSLPSRDVIHGPVSPANTPNRSAPISGGQYFWTAILAPRRYKRFCGYLIGLAPVGLNFGIVH